MLSCGCRVDHACRPIIRRDDRVQFPALRLRKRDGEAIVDLIARLGQHSRHDARSERSAVNPDACADLHALPLPIRKNRYHEALVAVDERRHGVPCIHMPAWRSTDVQDLAAGGSPHIGAGQGVQSLLLLVYKTLAIFQNRGKFFFLDSHSLFVEVDVPALLNEGTDCNEIVSHINAFLQGIELCEFLIELRVFGIRIMKRG